MKFAEKTKAYNQSTIFSRNMDLNEQYTPNNRIALALDYLEEVNYALVLSKVDICNWCIIENNSDADLEGILLEISGDYVETYSSMPLTVEVRSRSKALNILSANSLDMPMQVSCTRISYVP